VSRLVGSEMCIRDRFYIGPNDYKSLDAVANGFSANVYLGWPPVKWVNKYFIVPVFQFLTGLTSNYGLIIIILVIIIRLVLLPLSYKSYLGMAKMRLLKPELDELKLKYQDDQMKFSQEQMKLFSEVGASPFAGCIPLLLQMPILFAMFYLFPSSIEFRQQTLPFADDISTYDSVLSFSFALPLIGSHISIYTLLMTLSTLAITWQNNQISTVDGPMKSLSYIMPLVFFFVLNSFPASLSFYYLVGNLASFGQQLLIKRFVDEDKIKAVMEEHRKKMTSSGTGNKSAFMSKLTDALKASEEARKKNKRS
jgi:YidC/Oxa1 family membrane protein insertase